MTLSQKLLEIRDAVRSAAAQSPAPELIPQELEAAANAYFERGGKMIRPALCVLCAEALGGKDAAARALIPALAAEYFHLFTLIHDDVIDHDDLRRGGASAHALARELCGLSDPGERAEVGLAAAILAGDALVGRAFSLLAGAPGLSDACRTALVRKLAGDTLPKLASGEALDTKLSYLPGIPEEATLGYVYQNKTGVLFEFALYAGACAALEDVPDEALENKIRYAAAHIGEAFQLTDDYLGLCASEEATGKPALSDIREGKRTYFVRFAYTKATEEEKALLDRTLGAPAASAEDVSAVRDLLLTYGKDEYLARTAEALKSASVLLDPLPESDAKHHLFSLFKLMIRRDN